MGKLDDILAIRTSESYDYNMGLLPDEEGYSPAKEQANFTAAQENEQQKQAVKNLILEFMDETIGIARTNSDDELKFRQKVNEL